MRDPWELIELDETVYPGDMHADHLVVGLHGFIDAGHVQQIIGRHLMGNLEHQSIGSFAMDELFDYRARRPSVVFDRDRFKDYEAPEMSIVRLIDKQGRYLLLVDGPEPDFQWERFSAAIVQLCHALGVQSVSTIHGIPMGVPHTRPLGMTFYGEGTQPIREDEPLFGSVTMPASAQTVMHMRLSQANIPAIGIAVHIPHYLLEVDYAAGALAGLQALLRATDLDIPVDELRTLQGLHKKNVAEYLTDNREVTDLVEKLESHYDTYAALHRARALQQGAVSLPSADEIGDELEQFLREGLDPK